MDIFDLKFYKILLKEIQNNYKIIDYGDIYSNDNEKSLLIRHDIDVSLYDALELAKIEAEFNIKSTYFIWIKSPFYNALSVENQKNLLKIIELGHDIALHFDPTGIEEKDFEKAVSFEIEILENIIQKKLTAISFHMPYASLIRSENKYIAGLPQVYSKDIFDTYEYIADSNCKWSKPIKKLFNGEFEKVQLLVHPEWWVNFEVENRYRVLKSISKNRMRDEIYHLSLSGLFNEK